MSIGTHSDGESEQGSDEDYYNDYRLAYNAKNASNPLDQGITQNGVSKCQEYVKSDWRGKQLITDARSNRFWVDLGIHLVEEFSSGAYAKKDFISSNFIYLGRAMIPIATAYTGFNFEADVEAYSFEEREDRFFIRVFNSTVIFSKYLKETQQTTEAKLLEAGSDGSMSSSILSAQKIFDPAKPTIYNPNTNRDVPYDPEFLVKNKKYGCQLVVTNISSIPMNLQIITEIPQGAIPIIVNEFHKTVDIELQGFKTEKLEYFFYFPAEGEFDFCPACITTDEGSRIDVKITGKLGTNGKSDSKLASLTVHRKNPTKLSEASVGVKIDFSSVESITEYLANEANQISNSQIFNLNSILHQLKDSAFYKKVIDILKKRGVFDFKIYAFSLLHGDVDTFKLFFKNLSSNRSEYDNSNLSKKKIRGPSQYNH